MSICRLTLELLEDLYYGTSIPVSNCESALYVSVSDGICTIVLHQQVS